MPDCLIINELSRKIAPDQKNKIQIYYIEDADFRNDKKYACENWRKADLLTKEQKIYLNKFVARSDANIRITEKRLEKASIKSQKKTGKAQFESEPVEKRSSSRTGRGSLVTIRLPNGMYVTKKVVSMREGRYKNVVPQKFDLSCGAASLATILNYFYNDKADEIDIIKYMLDQGDKEEISQKGFSLLDLKKYAVHKDYLADGYKVHLKALRKLIIPAIILFTSGKYSHFVVLKGVRDDKVYIADPAYGNRSMSIKSFEDNWNGIIFIVASRDKQNQTPLPFKTTLPAPVLSVLRIQQLMGGGFASFRAPGEF